jgi:cyclase
MGAGEFLINSIENDGSMVGYDTRLIKHIASNTNLPVIACGGAGSIHDFKNAVQNGASAVAAGSLFVYSSRSKGILINYPRQETLINEFYSQL